jgi:hypothetical protein
MSSVVGAITGQNAAKKQAQAQQIQFQNQMAAQQRQAEATRKQLEAQKAMQNQQQVGRQMRRRASGENKTQTILTSLGGGDSGNNTLLGA